MFSQHRKWVIINSSVADPDFELRWGPGFGLLALPAFLPSVISSFFTQNKWGGGGGRAPWAPPLDPPLQLLDEVFVIPGIIKVEVSVISRSRRLRMITLTEILIISYITKTESNNCLTIHYRTEHSLFSIRHVLTSLSVNLTLLLEIMHCACNLQIIH